MAPRPAPAPLATSYRETPLWREGVVAHAVPQVALPRRVDVAIVGSGYAGLTAAWALAQRGRAVAVLEARELGFGGSTRNGGMVIPELKHDLRWLTARYGRLGRALVDSVVEAFDLVERLVAGTPIDCEYERTGGLLLAHRPSAVPALREAAREWVDDLGESAWFVPRDELSREIGTTEYHGGLVVEKVAGIQPAQYHAGLVRGAAEAGVVLSERTRAIAIERGATRFRVLTTRGVVEADDVLVATNAYADGLVPELRRHVLPLGSYIIATEALEPALVKEISPRGRMFFDTKNFLFYWRMSRDGRMVFGGRTNLVPTTVSRARDVLYREMVRIHPQLRGVRVEHAWGGDVAITYDRLPHAGRIDGVAFVTGCNGTGVALSTWLGARAASWMLGEADAVPFARLPFPAIPLHRWRHAYLPLVGLWLRARDRLG